MAATINDRNVTEMERITGYDFNDKKLCVQALQMMQTPSAVVRFNRSFQEIPHNTRLAVLGDTVLTQMLCKMWFNAIDPHGDSSTLGLQMALDMRTGDPSPKSAWDSIRQNVLGTTGLHQRGVQLGIEQLILANPGTPRPFSAKMVASVFQAVFGAIYLDGGEDAVTAAVRHMGLADHPLLQADTEPY